MSSISLRSVAKSYGSLKVLKDIDLEVRHGEFVSLVGPSGCGKSTLLRMIAGLEEIGDGEISIGDRIVNNELPKNRNVAMVFQNYALYPHMSVAENMGFSLKMSKRPKAEIEERVRKAADILELASLLERYPRQLSGGQRQRVAIGRAIVRNPDAFLFDEPLSNLDAQLRIAMRSEILKLHRTLRTTTVYVTHDQVEAMTMSDRIVVMRGGNIEQIGTPLELYDRPANTFVASFVGSPAMNFIRGTVQEGGSRPALKFSEDFTVSLQEPEGLRGQREAILGIRPEHIVIDNGGHPFVVEFVEPTGAEALLIGRVSGQELNVIVRGRTAIRPGDTVPIRFPTEAIHLFDQTTTLRL
jgi:multiple sugar transport system ATP-binding protein